ncbi:MAG: hypothetical protein GY754_24995 [bacterium]|nr:hypothetical protein [bacterium]
MNNLVSHKLSWIFLGLQFLVALICLVVGVNSIRSIESLLIVILGSIIGVICIFQFAVGGVVSGIIAIVNSSKNNYSRSGPIASLVVNSIPLLLCLYLVFISVFNLIHYY